MDTPRKKLGFWMCTALVMGNMIGSGIFLLPASLGAYGGISMAGWFVSAAGATVLALVFAHLARLVREAGGPYAYTRAGFGDFPAFLVAWGYWISIWTTNAAIAVAFVSYLTVFLPALGHHNLLAAGTGLAAIWVLTAVNAGGVHAAGVVQLVTTILKVLPLAVLGLLGVFYMDPGNFVPLVASGGPVFPALTATVALTLWAFLGLESGSIPAGDVEEPTRTIPRATVIGTLATAVLYILGTAAVMGVIPSAQLAGSNAPFADAARLLWGGWAGYAVGIGAVISCFGALNGWLLLQGQIPLAAARDGLFPAYFARTGANGTPVHGLVFSSVLASVLLLMNYSRSLVEQFTFIILLATLNTLVPYVFCSIALLLITRRAGHAGGNSTAATMVLAVSGFLYALWAIGGAGQEIVYWGFLLLMAGVPVYAWVSLRGDRFTDV